MSVGALPGVSDGLVEWALAERCKPGERVSGDSAIIVAHDGGVLAGAIDGLGHGHKAAAASESAREALKRFAGDPVDELLRRCHAALAGTRGAAVTLARFDEHGMRWLAVGNVAGILVRPAMGGTVTHLPLRGGIVGSRIPSLQNPDHVALVAGDLIVLATDGIRSAFSRAVNASAEPGAIATGLLGEFARDSDDALVLVLRYLGDGGP